MNTQPIRVSLSAPKEVRLDDDIVIDLQSAVPYYHQLKQYIIHKIQSGAWQAGQKLPSEKELCDQLSVSRSVVRQAVAELAREGMITTRRGRGSFVTSEKHDRHLLQTLTGFFDDAASKGKKVTSVVLEMDVVPAKGEVARKLEIPEGTTVIKITRLRFIDNEPFVLGTTYIPEFFCPNLVTQELEHVSLYGILKEQYGLVITTGVRSIECANADAEVARALNAKPGAAVMLLKSTGRLRDGTPLEYFQAWHRGDRSRFEVQLVNPDT